MLKLVAAHRGGGTMLVLGLSAGNVGQLQDDRPIVVDLAELGIDGGELRSVMVFAGDTESLMMEALLGAGLVHAEHTVLDIDPKLLTDP